MGMCSIYSGLYNGRRTTNFVTPHSASHASRDIFTSRRNNCCFNQPGTSSYQFPHRRRTRSLPNRYSLQFSFPTLHGHIQNNSSHGLLRMQFRARRLLRHRRFLICRLSKSQPRTSSQHAGGHMQHGNRKLSRCLFGGRLNPPDLQSKLRCCACKPHERAWSAI